MNKKSSKSQSQSKLRFKSKSNPQPLSRSELDSVLSEIKSKNGLNPQLVERFLATDFETTPPVLSKADQWIPAVLLGLHLLVLTWLNYSPETLPEFFTLSPIIHQFLQSFHNLTGNAASSELFRDHLPVLLLEAAGGYGVLKTIPNWLNLRSKGEIAREAQTKIREKTERGEMQFEMAKNHTAAFVGNGDWLADRLQEIKPTDEVIQYSNLKIVSNVWQLIFKQSRKEDFFTVLDRGHFENAGEILILPVQVEDMFLPGDEQHDMSLDEVVSLIGTLDAYCVARKTDTKKVLIVGKKDLLETYISRSSTESCVTSTTTLAERIAELKKERGTIEIIDPTEIVLQKIIALAKGRTIILAGALASDKRYGLRFFKALKNIGYKAKSDKKDVRIFYNITDIPTEVHVGKNDIAVLLDPSKKEALLDKGITEENIIVVPDEVVRVLSVKVEEV